MAVVFETLIKLYYNKTCAYYCLLGKTEDHFLTFYFTSLRFHKYRDFTLLIKCLTRSA